VKALELNAEGVSRYLCLQRGEDPNVWMKDLWQDEGREPDDPATEGEPMWKSPYIWVRRTEDEILGKEYAHLEHEHEHEDPQEGQTNYVYVKLHNTGGTKESAKLELYFAGPSTNLDHPASWTLIGSKPRTIEPGVDVAKFEWSNIPGSGHYCLLARWNIDGGPLAFTSLGDAVRADNDLIWRNVNVIELGASLQTESVFAMAGDEQSDETYLLITTKPISRRKLDREQLVGASIEVVPTRLNRGELRVEGLTQRGRREFEFVLGNNAKLIGPFMLRRGETTRVKLTTIADPGAVKKRGEQLANPAHYDITVMQIRPAGAKFFENPSELFERALVIGGVSYTLRVPAGR
jgi:hypothetical protein